MTQRTQRFLPDQRLDLPKWNSGFDLLSAEFNAYNKAFISPLNRILKNWVIESNGGLQVRANIVNDSFLFNSLRVGKENIVYRKSSDPMLTANLADNTTNYVEVQIVTATCSSDTVALWDSSANSGAGQEFTQIADTITEETPSLVSNTVAFTGATNKLPLAVVVTAGGIISSITDARNMLFHVDADWNFGVTRTDKTIDSLKAAYDALATAIKEIKGSVAWYDVPFAGTKFLKEYQNMFVSGGGSIEWEGTQGANTLGWSATIQIEIADRSTAYTVAAGTATIGEGQAAYLDIPAGVPGGPLTFTVANLSDVPIDPTSVGYSPRIQVLFFRRGGKIYGMMDLPELDSGEVASIGMDLPSVIRSRLGILSETSYVAYTSTNYVGVSDNYADAISALDNELFLVANDNAAEEDFSVVAPQTIFNATFLDWIFDNTIPDIQVYVNGDRVKLSPTGLSANGDYKKNSTTQLEFFVAIPAGAFVTIRDERSGGAGGVDLIDQKYTVGIGGQTNFVTTQPFTISQKIDVFENGVLKYETDDYTRNVGLSRIQFVTARPQDAVIRIRLYV